MPAADHAGLPRVMLPGFGACQVAAAHHLQEVTRKTVEGRAKLGVSAFAEALLGIPKILAENSGFDAQVACPHLQQPLTGLPVDICDSLPRRAGGATANLIRLRAVLRLCSACCSAVPLSACCGGLGAAQRARVSQDVAARPVQKTPVAPTLSARLSDAVAWVEAQDAIIALDAEVERGNKVGLDVATGEPLDPALAGIYDNLLVKRQMLHSAPVVAAQLLLVDEVIRAGMNMRKAS